MAEKPNLYVDLILDEEMNNYVKGKTLESIEQVSIRSDSYIVLHFTDSSVLSFQYDYLYGWSKTYPEG